MTRFFLMSRFSVFIISSFLRDVLHICLQFVIIVLNLREGMKQIDGKFFLCRAKGALGNSFSSNKAASRRASKHIPNFFAMKKAPPKQCRSCFSRETFSRRGIVTVFRKPQRSPCRRPKRRKKGARCALSSFLGGAKGSRTPDLLNAIQTRYQLRYNPIDNVIILYFHAVVNIKSGEFFRIKQQTPKVSGSAPFENGFDGLPCMPYAPAFGERGSPDITRRNAPAQQYEARRS